MAEYDCNLKPTSRPISEMRAEQTESFFGCMSCNSSAAELAALSQPLVGWLVDSPPSPHAPPRLASPSRRERGECSAAEGHRRRRLRVRRRPAPPEPTGLDLVTVVASPATVRRSATVPSPGATHLAIWTSSMRSPLLYRSRRGATVPSALSVDNDSARPWTTTRWR